MINVEEAVVLYFESIDHARNERTARAHGNGMQVFPEVARNAKIDSVE